MKRRIADYLGFRASIMLKDEPFKDWTVERSLETDLDPAIVHYVFPGRGLELRCDDDEKISVIFLQSGENHQFDDILTDPFFSWSREQVMEHFGKPSTCGDKSSHPVLGDYGAWDRFELPRYTIHFEYKRDSPSVSKITFMRNDVVP